MASLDILFDPETRIYSLDGVVQNVNPRVCGEGEGGEEERG